MTAIKILRAWKDGPLRQMAAERLPGFMPFGKTIEKCDFAGKYVCDRCNQPSGGLLLRNASKVQKNEQIGVSQWLCEPCMAGKTRKPLSADQKQALIARLAAARLRKAVTVEVFT